MEPHAPLFPSFAAPLSDLYGASSFRAAEAHASAQDLDELDREELALERTVRALVDRQAPQPIGLKFHRAPAAAARSHVNASATPEATPGQRLQRGGVAPVGTEGSRLGSGVQTTRGYHGPVAEDEDEEEEEDDDEDEMEEDELEELEDDDEDEDEDDEELFAGERDQDDDSMDMSM